MNASSLLSRASTQLADGIHSFLHRSSFAAGYSLAVVIGLVAGFSAIAFRGLINFFHALLYDHSNGFFNSFGNFSVIVIPALGGLLVGIIVYTLAREAKGHGVPEVMYAVARLGGRIRGRVAIVKAFASSIAIGSGGSVGREGPIVQIGSSAASFLAQRFRANDNLTCIFVAAGAAGGISATFNAPLAGSFFALEVILRRFSVQNFGIVVLSSVVAAAVSHVMIGNVLSFEVTPYSLVSSQELIYYAALGVISAFLGVTFMEILYWFEDSFDAIKVIPEWMKPAIGGLILGCIGMYFPQIFGVGYESMNLALVGKLNGMDLLALLALLKILATSLTLGSGSSGGVFAPSLFIGAMAGTAFGLGIQTLLPEGSIGPAGGYGLVGMAAVFAAASNAPITAILIVFEMTLDYSIILPLMLGVVLSTAIARGLSAETIYTLKLLRRGVRLSELGDPDVRSRIRIKNIMTRDYPVVRTETPVQDLLGMFAREKTHGFPVLDGGGALCGVVTITDVERALIGGDTRDISVADIATTTLIVAYHNELLADFLERPGSAEVGYIPVVMPDDPKKLTGVVRRHDILKAYNGSKEHFSLGFERRKQNAHMQP